MSHDISAFSPRAHDEIVHVLDRVRRVDLGTLYLLLEEVLGLGHEREIAEAISTLLRMHQIRIETLSIGQDGQGPLIGFVERLNRPPPD